MAVLPAEPIAGYASQLKHLGAAWARESLGNPAKNCFHDSRPGILGIPLKHIPRCARNEYSVVSRTPKNCRFFFPSQHRDLGWLGQGNGSFDDAEEHGAGKQIGIDQLNLNIFTCPCRTLKRRTDSGGE